MKRMMEKFGFTHISTAGSVKQALQVLIPSDVAAKSLIDIVDIVMSDIGLPDGVGAPLSRVLFS